MELLMRPLVLVFLTLLFSCASEEWDNRFDPESDAFRSQCSGVPADFAEGCVFWEDFDMGLSRWLISESPAGVGAPAVAANGPYGVVKDVLALPGCDGRGPSLVTELEMPGGEVELSALWVSAPDTKGQLGMEARGGTLRTAEGPAEEAAFDGWRESITTFQTSPGERLVFRIINSGEAGESCSQVGLYVAHILLRELPE